MTQTVDFIKEPAQILTMDGLGYNGVELSRLYVLFRHKGQIKLLVLREIADHGVDKGLFKFYKDRHLSPKGFLDLTIHEGGDGHLVFVSRDHKEMHVQFQDSDVVEEPPITGTR